MVERMLELIDAENSTRGMFLKLVIESLKLLGRDTELEIVKRMAAKKVYDNVLSAWAAPDFPTMENALFFARLLDQPELIPDGWFASLRPEIKRNWMGALLDYQHARLHRQWKKVIEATDRVLAWEPHFYHLYWERGVAFRELGKLKKSQEALAVYTQFSKDEIEYPRALALMKKNSQELAGNRGGRAGNK